VEKLIEEIEDSVRRAIASQKEAAQETVSEAATL
jgi:hypothetical protein